MRKLSYSLAINEALHQTMSADKSVFVMGQGLKSPWYVGNTAKDLIDTFGEKRVIDTPVSENGITGAAVGAAIAGMRPVVVHPRMDFMLYAIDPIVNEAANWSYMNGGMVSAPVVFWGIVNRGGEQAAQHSQSLHALFSHVPGLKVVMPSTPYDAKGLMVSAIRDENPVVFVDDRWLYSKEDEVPEEIYEVEIGKAIVRKEGQDITIAATSYMAHLAESAVEQLSEKNISAELVDMRTAKPLDTETLLKSVSKTGKLLVLDGGWRACGLSAEIVAEVSEKGFSSLNGPVRRLTLPDCPAPASSVLEKVYYPSVESICDAINEMLG